MAVLTLTNAMIVLASPKTSLPRVISSTFTFKMAMQKLRSEATIPLARVVVAMITGVVTGLEERSSVGPALTIVRGAVGTEGGRCYTARDLEFMVHKAGIRRGGEECVTDGRNLNGRRERRGYISA